jgi:hypothetical protein
MLAVVLIMGALGVGRSFLMLLLGWSAYQAGAVELNSHVFFIAHFVVGIVVVGIAVALVIRARWAWVAALIASIAMLIEEIVRSVPLFAAGGVTTTLAASAIYVAFMVVMIVLLTRKSSRSFLKEAS